MVVKVESFELDHTIVKAPYVRAISVKEGEKGDKVSNFDLRLSQPNKDIISTGAIHTLEHLLAGLMRERLDGIIDVSPFGCRTGFHLLIWGEESSEVVAKALKDTLTQIIEEIEWEDVQGTTAESCGNYKDHSLFSAKEWAKIVLEKGVSSDPFERKVV